MIGYLSIINSIMQPVVISGEQVHPCSFGVLFGLRLVWRCPYSLTLAGVIGASCNTRGKA
jgi:hypothetical protein